LWGTVHVSCFAEVSAGQNFTPGNFYFSVQCISYDNDAIKAKCESLMEHNNSQLRILARGLGAKTSYRPPGQGSNDLSKERAFQMVTSTKDVDNFSLHLYRKHLSNTCISLKGLHSTWA
jgi:hypothetical protein